MCAQLPVTHNLWEGPEDDWITVETRSPIVISENKCCADVKNWYIQTDQTTDRTQKSATHVFKFLTPLTTSVQKTVNLHGFK